MMTGVITKSTGSWYLIKTTDNQFFNARIKGKFRLTNTQNTNPIAVGDQVDFEFDKPTQTAVISHIHPRQNYIIRKSVNLAKQNHIIASNIDQAILLITLIQPETSFGFVDRFLVTAEAYSIPVVLVFNKIDLLDEENARQQQKYQKIYENIGYTCTQISALNLIDVSKIKTLLQDKNSMISGHSGAGKSTLINSLAPNLNLKTQQISTIHHKGQHTTTFAEMFDWPFGGTIIDTPGIKGLGLVEMGKDEVGDYFPEILNKKNQCKFHNCQHINEPHCAIIEAVKQGIMAKSRYQSYLSFVDEANEKNIYRTF